VKQETKFLSLSIKMKKLAIHSLQVLKEKVFWLDVCMDDIAQLQSLSYF